VSLALDQQIRFCTSSDGVRIAYATVGSGPPLVKAANWLSHLEFDAKSPVWRHWIRELSRSHTLVRYDERGCGLSDWEVDEFSLEAWVRDLEVVVDALELERFPLLGISQGGPIAIAYATRHPDRVSHLILYGTYGRGRAHWALSDQDRDEQELMLSLIRVGWGKDHPAFRQVFTSLFLPDGTPEQVHWFNELQRVTARPENAARMCGAFYALDVRKLARRLRIPTLVLHGTGDLRIPFAEGRRLASLVPGARFVPLESRNHILLESEPAWPRFLREVRTFLGVPADASSDPASRRRRIEALFDQALELAPSARAELLARECDRDPELRREVEALLAAAERSGVTASLAAAIAGPTDRLLASSPAPTLTEYEIVERLGGGGMGVVYKARDRRLQRFVALKFVPPSLGREAELKLRFLQEAKTIASLDHPNLCTIFEVAEPSEGQLVIVMPFYEGETLKEKIARGPMPLTQALDYALQIADGLAHAHAAGVVHRDIKPANVLVTSGDRVKILDFGIAKVSHASAQLTRTGTVVGTLTYMSPEQARGEKVGHQSDLWSLGVVLYEMLSGRPPFAADFMEALFYAIQWRDPIGVAALRPEVPPGLAVLVHRLLEKDPARRYEDAPSLAVALESLRAEVTAPSGSPQPDTPLPQRAPMRSHALLVGRTTELRQLGDLFRAACRGARQLAFITGEPGIGKSSLIRMFLEQVQVPGQVSIGRGQCLDQRGAGEPYMPVLEALGRLCREQGGAELIGLLERYAPTWLAQMPSLLGAARLESVQRRAFAPTRERMLREMVEALEAFTEHRPLALVLEDLHWSDPSTLDLLTALAHRPEPAQLLVLGTFRSGEAIDGLVGLVRTLRSQGRCAEIVLDVWSEADARAYLSARCAPGALPPEVRDLVLGRTAGHPLFVRSLLDDWEESGALVRDGIEWRLGMALEEVARSVPESLRLSIGQRIDALSPAQQELLEAASVGGIEFDVAAVAATLGSEEEPLEAELRRLARLGWVTAMPATAVWPDGTRTERYAFCHHLHHELLYGRLPPSRRARLHERIGRRLEVGYGDRATERAGELALHFSLGRDDERTVRYRKAAAGHALSRSAYAEAIAHLEAAVETVRRQPETPIWRRAELALQRMLAPALLVTRGWGDQAAEGVYQRARELSEALDDSEQLAKVLQSLAYLHELRGNYPLSQSLIEERLALPVSDPGSLTESHELLACSLFHQGGFDDALRHASRGLASITTEHGRPVIAGSHEIAAIACLWWSGLATWFLGRPDEAVTLTQRAIDLCGDVRRAHTLSLAQAQAARLFQHRREPERAAEHAARALDIAERQGYPYERALARVLLGWAEVLSGRVAPGLARLRLGLDGQAELGAAMERPYCLGLLADALAHAGEDEAALARIAEALALPETTSRSFFWEAELHRLRGVLHLRQGHPDLAEASLRQALRIASAQGTRALALRSAASLCRLHHDTGRASDAPGLLRGLLEGLSEGLGTPDLIEANALLAFPAEAKV
jgi:serine/threonine protein kinase/pimeloyl-ACP methyl ester carboxylesterase/tetratricopeptide (TPR) repeat protein